jgi:hypothetical protein
MLRNCRLSLGTRPGGMFNRVALILDGPQHSEGLSQNGLACHIPRQILHYGASRTLRSALHAAQLLPSGTCDVAALQVG